MVGGKVRGAALDANLHVVGATVQDDDIELVLLGVIGSRDRSAGGLLHEVGPFGAGGTYHGGLGLAQLSYPQATDLGDSMTLRWLEGILNPAAVGWPPPPKCSHV